MLVLYRNCEVDGLKAETDKVALYSAEMLGSIFYEFVFIIMIQFGSQ